jgi:signal transduction histidine kinase
MRDVPGRATLSGGRRPRGQGLLALVAGAVVVGIVAEATAFGLDQPEAWIPDLIVGLWCVGFGALVSIRQPTSKIGLILIGAGFAWFIGNFTRVPVDALAAVAAQFTFVHRAALVHAALTIPSGRTRGPLSLGTVAIAYVAWSVPLTAQAPALAIGLSATVSMVAGVDLVDAQGPARRIRAVALAATVLLGTAFSFAGIIHAAVPNGSADDIALFADQAAIVVVAGTLALATLFPRLRASGVTDDVVEASRPGSGVVSAALADALGDASVEIGYWHAPSGRYLDASGEPIYLPSESASRSVLRIDLDGSPAAVLVHDRDRLPDASLTDAVRAATTLAAANTHLRRTLLDQLAEVRASRRRLIQAADAELGRLERRIAAGPLRRTDRVAASLDRVEAGASARHDDALAAPVARAQAALGTARAELESLAKGLHPAVGEGGLAAALQALADRSPIPVAVTYQAGTLSNTVALAIYYACNEAIANVLKHANASTAAIRVWRGGPSVHLLVTDDGIGGADSSAGSGLRGIQDRIEAMDGRIDVVSVVGSGTRFAVEIPLSDEDG